MRNLNSQTVPRAEGNRWSILVREALHVWYRYQGKETLMSYGTRPRGEAPFDTGIIRISTSEGSVVLVDYETHCYLRIPGPRSRFMPGDGDWVPFSAVGTMEIGDGAIFISVTHVDRNYESSPIVAIERVVPPRELSAAEIETVRFVGDCINRRSGTRRWDEE